MITAAMTTVTATTATAVTLVRVTTATVALAIPGGAKGLVVLRVRDQRDLESHCCCYGSTYWSPGGIERGETTTVFAQDRLDAGEAVEHTRSQAGTLSVSAWNRFQCPAPPCVSQVGDKRSRARRVPTPARTLQGRARFILKETIMFASCFLALASKEFVGAKLVRPGRSNKRSSGARSGRQCLASL